ncbi:hypothetical protein COBT_004173, partial [Conglomerata obtusa]
MSNDVFAMKKSFGDKKRSHSYNKNSKTCILHGKQGHSTSECKLMDELKRKGVKVFYDRKKFGVNMMNATENFSDDEENINKNNESYLSIEPKNKFIHSIFFKNKPMFAGLELLNYGCIKNGFTINVILGNKCVKALIDTGADVSVLPIKMLHGISYSQNMDNIKIKSASGNDIKI